jgi:NAD(P)-dependent dehydrogenase (short-subunit alcohol dehydrogenase family)
MTDRGPRFEGKVAVVTGASKGIGRAVATQLGREGARVMLNARSADELAETEAELRAEGLDVASVAASLVDEGAPHAIVAAAAERFGPVDHVVNIVGINTWHGPLLGIPERKFARTVVGNSWPTLGLVQAAVEHGMDRGGSVVAISSIGARQVQPMLGHYSAGKAALEVVVRILARELGPRGIRINGVAPGLVRTEMSRMLWEGDKDEAESTLLPLQRLGVPEDVAGAVTFLLSPESDWITGVTLDVDGGRLLVGGEPRELFGVYDAKGESGG